MLSKHLLVRFFKPIVLTTNRTWASMLQLTESSSNSKRITNHGTSFPMSTRTTTIQSIKESSTSLRNSLHHLFQRKAPDPNRKSLLNCRVKCPSTKLSHQCGSKKQSSKVWKGMFQKEKRMHPIQSPIHCRQRLAWRQSSIWWRTDWQW